MPHVFVNRPRLHALIGDDPSRREHFRWERVNAIVYLLGGVLFVWGSVLFFPALETRADRGAWIFFVGSVLYLVVTGHDIAEVVRHRRTLRSDEVSIWDRLEVWAATGYLLGTVCFLAGSVFFLSSVARYDAGAWLFVIGSVLFVFGAVINTLQVVQVSDARLLQLLNLTALTFVTGSLLFAVASVPYLFDLRDPEDERTIDAFLAGQYVVGSVLFLAGGVFNYWRAYTVVAREIGAESSGSTKL